MGTTRNNACFRGYWRPPRGGARPKDSLGRPRSHHTAATKRNAQSWARVLAFVCYLAASPAHARDGETTTSGHTAEFIASLQPGTREISIPQLDISGKTDRHVVIAQGTRERRQGHANTLLLPDGQTMLVAWTYGHGGACGPLKRSVDGGRSWSDLIEVPDNWRQHANCPALYNLPDSEGNARLYVFANRGPQGHLMYQAHSDDGGQSWSPFQPSRRAGGDDPLGEGESPAATVMPFTAIVPIKDGAELLAVTNLRRPDQTTPTNVLAQTQSADGGRSWSDWRITLDLGEPFKPCEPDIVRSPDGRQLLMIARENHRSFNSWIMLSNDEGATWSKPFQATAAVTMDRHQHQYAEDGRLVIVGRDTAQNSPTRGHFVAWVGTYDDLVAGREGQYRVKLLPHHGGSAVEYPDIERLPDGVFVATNSVRYRAGENYSVVSTRFTLKELDELAAELASSQEP